MKSGPQITDVVQGSVWARIGRGAAVGYAGVADDVRIGEGVEVKRAGEILGDERSGEDLLSGIGGTIIAVIILFILVPILEKSAERIHFCRRGHSEKETIWTPERRGSSV